MRKGQELKKVIYLQKLDGAGGVRYVGYNEWGQKITGWDPRDISVIKREASKGGYKVRVVDRLSDEA